MSASSSSRNSINSVSDKIDLQTVKPGTGTPPIAEGAAAALTEDDLATTRHKSRTDSLDSVTSTSQGNNTNINSQTTVAASPISTSTVRPAAAASLSVAKPTTTPHCLVFMRNAFGSSPGEQSKRATDWLVHRLGANYVISSRLYFHGHWANAQAKDAALLQSQQHNSQTKHEFEPAAALCFQKQCGHERVSVERRVAQSGLNYTTIRRWILSSKKVILNEEVFRAQTTNAQTASSTASATTTQGRHRKSDSDISGLPLLTAQAAEQYHNEQKAILANGSTVPMTSHPTNNSTGSGGGGITSSSSGSSTDAAASAASSLESSRTGSPTVMRRDLALNSGLTSSNQDTAAVGAASIATPTAAAAANSTQSPPVVPSKPPISLPDALAAMNLAAAAATDAQTHASTSAATPSSSAATAATAIPTAVKPAAAAAGASSALAPAPGTAGGPPPLHKRTSIAPGLKVYIKSRQGQSYDSHKLNQDRPIACVPLKQHPGLHVYGVLDGHGKQGHYVSEYIMQNLPLCLTQERDLRTNTAVCLRNALRRVCQLLADSGINLHFSGSTCVVAVHILSEGKLFVANLGDSRATLCRDVPSTDEESGVIHPFTCIPLTTDHKPDAPGEFERIRAKGGRVMPIPGLNLGPNRVWLPLLDEPGLAMSRSIGDLVAQSAGTTDEPEIRMHQLVAANDLFCIFASDGIFEFISNTEACALLYRLRHDAALAVNTLVAEAVKRWQADCDQVIDDITVVLVVFK